MNRNGTIQVPSRVLLGTTILANHIRKVCYGFHGNTYNASDGSSKISSTKVTWSSRATVASLPT